jgi:hypothetical protein
VLIGVHHIAMIMILVVEISHLHLQNVLLMLVLLILIDPDHAQVPNAVSPQDTTTCIWEQMQVADNVDQLVHSSGSTSKSHDVNIVASGVVYLPDRTSTNSITATTVSTYTRDQEKEGNADNDMSVKLVKEKDSFTPDEYYDVAITRHIMAAEEDEPCIKYNPCGFNSTKRTMPSAYCKHCHCPMRKCHNLLFGKYCQLHIVEVGQFCTYDAMTKLLVDKHFSSHYNEALQYVIFQATGLLDLKKYKLPVHLIEEAFKQSVNYFIFRHIISRCSVVLPKEQIETKMHI